MNSNARVLLVEVRVLLVQACFCNELTVSAILSWKTLLYTSLKLKGHWEKVTGRILKLIFSSEP